MNNEAQTCFKKLTQTLESLVKSYRVLLDQVRQEKEYLVEIEIDKLNELNKEKEILLNKIHQAENTRIRVAEDFADLVGVLERPVHILDLAQCVGGSEAEKLRNMHATLDLLLKRIIEINKTNAVLAEGALKATSGALDNIKQTIGGKKSTYERQGKMAQNSESSSGAFVRKGV